VQKFRPKQLPAEHVADSTTVAANKILSVKGIPALGKRG
jgi:hypothetical protein